MKSTTNLAALIVLATSFASFAQNDRAAFKEAMDACVAETGVSQPERGSRPSDEDRTKIDACLSAKGISKPQGGGRGHRPQMDDSVKAAFESCIASTGVAKPERGSPPSEEDRAKLDACLSDQGITLPQGGPRASNQ